MKAEIEGLPASGLHLCCRGLDSPGWEGLPLDLAWLQEVLCLVIEEVPLPLSTVEISLFLADDATVRMYNRNYRGKDEATNVLSFPVHGRDELKELEELKAALQSSSFTLPHSHPPLLLPLGDIILAFETVQREAREKGISAPNHLAHLIIHGALHLLGYDHEEEQEAQMMEALEVKILARLGVPDPYHLCQKIQEGKEDR